MFSNYLKTALRHIIRHKGYSLLNIAGLAIGLAGSTLILVYVRYELSYDTFHKKADRIYRVYKRDPGNIFIGSDYFAVVPAPLGPAMEDDFPEIEETVKFTGVGAGLVQFDEKRTMETRMMWAEPSVFGIFDIPLLRGDPATALNEPNSVVLSESSARRIFGNMDPMDQMIRVRDTYDMRVTGVMSDIPANSHVWASMLLSFATYEAERRKDMTWGNSSFQTYALVREGADISAVREKLPALVQKYLGELFKQWGKEEPTQFFLQPLNDVHLHSANINFGPVGMGDIKTVYILTALALILLATASMNYMNLATARASFRAREVGIRKVIGANRTELVRQFIGESVLTALVGGGAGLAIVELSLPAFSRLVDRQLTASILSDLTVIPQFIGLTILVGIVSGSFPAFLLSAFSPVEVFKRAWQGRGRSWFRDILVVLQFSAATALALCAIVILNQLSFIKTTDPGYNRDQVLSIRTIHQEVIKNLPAFRSEVTRISGVAGFTASTNLPIEVGSSGSISVIGDNGEKTQAQSYRLYTDEEFLDVYKIPLVSGRFFEGGPAPEDQEPSEYVVNETFARTFGLKEPVGKIIERSGGNITIIGVVRDFHMHSFREGIAPLVIANRSDRWVSYVSLRLRPEGLSETIEQIRLRWTETIKDFPFDYAFVDESFDKMYERDQKLAEIVSLFTVLALFIASMGLFGLATFVTQTRRKEIGIRKVLGASALSVAALLSREFMILVGIANLIGWPVAYYLMDEWLNDFAYRINLSPWLFLLAGGAAALVALVTVSSQAIRAADANPVESLRYE